MEAIFSLLVLSLLPLTSLSLSLQTLHNTPSFDYNLALFGDAEIADGGSSVQLTRPIPSSSGLLLSEKPFKFLEPNPVPKPSSFSTEFSFSISSHSGDGISLVLVPADFPRKFSGKKKSHFGFSREINKFLGIELNANHIGVEVCGFGSSRVRNVSSSIGLVLNSGKKLRAWVDYEASSKRLEVRLGELGKNVRPYDPVIAFPIDLSEMWRGEKVLVGLSSSSGNSIQTCSVYSWEFRVRSVPNWMHSQPVDPLMYTEKERTKSKRSPCLLTILSGLMLVIGCGVLVAFTVLALWGIVNRRVVIPALHPVDFGYEKVSVVVEDSSENAIGGVTGELLEQNALALDQISVNFASFKMHENIHLFCQTRNNILTILNDLNDTPEIMKQMPPLPVKLNKEIANSILPRSALQKNS